MKQSLFTLVSVLVFSLAVNAQNVGVGTDVPASKLEVKGISGDENSIGTLRLTNGTGSTELRLGTLDGTRSWIQSSGSLPLYINRLGNHIILNETGGNVGIGTASPGQKLEVNGKLLLHNGGTTYNNPGVAELQVGYAFSSAGTAGEVARLALQPYGHTGGPFVFYNRDDASSAYLDIRYGSSNLLSLIHNGNVGLGTQNPAAKLHIIGSTWPQEIIDQASGHAILDIRTTDATNYEQGIRFYRNGVHQAEIYTLNGDQKLHFYITGNDRMTIDNSGNVRIPALSATSAVYTDGSSNLTTNPPATGVLGYWTRTGSGLFPTTLSDRIGIGVNTPQAVLDVRRADNSAGDAIAFGTQTYYMGRLGENAATNKVYIANTYNNDASYIDFRLKGNADSDSKMIIKGDGNVGIGTTAPGAKLQVAGGGAIIGTTSSGSNPRTLTILNDGQSQINFGSYPWDWSPALQIQNNDNTKFVWINPGGSAAYPYNARFYAANTGLDFYTGSNAFAATIASDGKVGIGTSSPAFKLDVQSGYAAISDIAGGSNNTKAFVEGGNGVAYFGALGTQRAVFGNSENWETLVADDNNIGIGTNTPAVKLDLQAATGMRIGYSNYEANLVFGNISSWKSGIRVYDNGVAEMRIWHVNSSGKIFLSTGYNGDQSSTLPTDGMVIYGNKVGIGNLVPAYKLDVAGQIYNSINTTLSSYTATNAIFEQANSAYNSGITLRNPVYGDGGIVFGKSNGGGVNAGSVTSMGSYVPMYASGFTTVSDITMKKDVQYLDEHDYSTCLNQIRNIQSIRFRYLSESATKDENSQYRPHLHIGVVAQSLPEEVVDSIDADASSPAGGQKLGMSLPDMSGLMLAGMKALDAQNQMLQQKVEELQKEIEELKKK